MFFAMSTVVAHTGASGIIKERMDAMSDMKDKAKLASDMLKGKTEFDANVITQVAETFVLHGSTMKSLFPDTEESQTGKTTRALPRVWQEWDIFLSELQEFETNSNTLLQLTQSSTDINEVKKKFLQTTKNCSSCHKRFREPKK